MHNKVPVSCIRSLVSGDSEKKISAFLISFIAGTILHIIGLECFRDVIAMSKILEKKTIFLLKSMKKKNMIQYLNQVSTICIEIYLYLCKKIKII